MPAQTSIVRHETFAPLLYVLSYDELEQAIALNNDVPQGLSSCIFSNDLREVESFLSAAGSDCGMANVNIGPSGAEIGGAFGGEKRPAATAKAAPTPGSSTCAAPPTPSTTRASCRWPRAFSSGEAATLPPLHLHRTGKSRPIVLVRHRPGAENGLAHAHHGSALLDGDFKVAGHPHGQLIQDMPAGALCRNWSAARAGTQNTGAPALSRENSASVIRPRTRSAEMAGRRG
jgi:hypothetical protein